MSILVLTKKKKKRWVDILHGLKPRGFLYPLARTWSDMEIPRGLTHAGYLTRVASSMAQRGLERRGIPHPLARIWSFSKIWHGMSDAGSIRFLQPASTHQPAPKCPNPYDPTRLHPKNTYPAYLSPVSLIPLSQNIKTSLAKSSHNSLNSSPTQPILLPKSKLSPL